MKKALVELKNIFPIDYNYIKYLKTISPSIDSNINFNTFVKIIVAFVGSIFFSNFILSYTPLTIKLNEVINFYYLLQVYILNAVSYSVLLAIFVLIFLKKTKFFLAYFIQGIKMFTIFNLTLSLLFVLLINIKVNTYLNQSSTVFLLSSIFLFLTHFYILYKFLYKELVVSFNGKKHTKKIALFIFFVVPFFNNIIYNEMSYNSVNINKLFLKKNLCIQIIDVKYDRFNDNAKLVQDELRKCYNNF